MNRNKQVLMDRANVCDSTNKTMEQLYNIALDIGTSSVGWCVTDMNGKLMKFKRRNMWGARLFDKGQTAETRRLKRSLRRRYARRRQRIILLQNLLGDMVNQKDKNFFVRLNESFLWKCDKTEKSDYLLFADKDYTDKEYYKKYPTIYHLRKHLIESNEKADPRMVYLAIHNIIKHRGHFLYQGQKFEEVSDLSDIINELSDCLKCNFEGAEFKIEKEVIEKVEEIFNEKTKEGVNNEHKKSKAEKCEDLEKILVDNKWDKKISKEIAKACLGYKFNVGTVIGESELKGEDGKSIKIQFDDSKYEEKILELAEKINDKIEIINILQNVYSWIVMEDILSGYKYISDAMVDKYERHNKQLNMLKRLFRKYLSRDDYLEFFRKEKGKEKDEEKDKDKNKEKYIINYVNYIKRNKRCANTKGTARENLYNEIKGKFKGMAENDAEYQLILQEMDNDEFLLKQKDVNNSNIPYQINLIELEKIIDNQGKYYPVLLENREKIIKLLTFRIPYYIGPVNPRKNDNKFAWVKKKEGHETETVNPWNLEEIVDIDVTAERFIDNMTGFCTYLPEEKVLPKNSLIYQEYKVLNELNKIKVNDKGLDIKTRNDIIEGVFKKQKNINEKTLKTYLLSINYLGAKIIEEYKIEGYQGDKQFANSMGSYIDFKKILGSVDVRNLDMIEEIVYWLTVFEEKSIVKRKMIQKYSDKLSEKQLSRILDLKYDGWGRFSKKFLTGIYGDYYGEKKTIMDVLKEDNKLPNLMQIINKKEFGFNEIIEKNRIKLDEGEVLKDAIDKIHCSPEVRRGIWQSMKLVEEVIEIENGVLPQNIYIEFARSEEDKKRTKKRKNKLEAAYKVLKKEIDVYNEKVLKELGEYKEKLDDEKVYLYFLQNGQCMYTKQELNLNGYLKDCEIDHIIPQSVYDEDSLDNKVLVLKGANQEKGNRIPYDYIKEKNKVNWESMKIWWEKLYKCGLMSEKKYKRLTTQNIGEIINSGFIKRQLTVTSQMIKNVANLITDYYGGKVNVMAVRAAFSTKIRKTYSELVKGSDGNYIEKNDGDCFIKNRFLNDFHHAHDAYLASIIGKYLNTVYPKMADEINYNKYIKYYNEQCKKNRKQKFNFILSKFDKIFERDGEIVWNGVEQIKYLKNILNYRDCIITHKLEENTGSFYDENRLPKNDKSEKLIPIKEGLPVERYGGYQGGEAAYCCLVSYVKKKKQQLELVKIPVMTAKKIYDGKTTLENYLKEKMGLDDIHIIRKKIMKYQLIEEDGCRYYLVSAEELANAKQLVLGSKNVRFNRILNIIEDNRCNGYSPEYIQRGLDDFYEFLIGKIQKEFGRSSSVAKEIYDTKVFYELESAKDKGDFIMEILKLTNIGSDYPYLKKYKKYNKISSSLIDRKGRSKYQGYKIKPGTVLIDQSVTGLYERRLEL